jgi:hypothetical protein
MLLLARASELWLAGEDTEHPDRLLSYPVVLYRSAQTLDHSLGGGGCEVPGTDNLLWCGRPGSLMSRTFCGESHPCQRDLIWCQGNHDDYVCSRGRAAMSGGDGMDFSTRVPI